MHKSAEDAARAVECAARQGRFETYQALLFSTQDQIGQRSWTAYAQNAGLSDANAFEVCMNGHLTLAPVERDRAAGRKLGVIGTPTLLINDLALPGYPGSDKLRNMVLSALEHARTQPRS